MSVEDERLVYFNQLRTAILNDIFADCHDNVNFLLSTETSELKETHEKKYNELRDEMHNDIQKKKIHYIKGGKRLSEGAMLTQYEVIREHEMWLDFYSYLYNELILK